MSFRFSNKTISSSSDLFFKFTNETISNQSPYVSTLLKTNVISLLKYLLHLYINQYSITYQFCRYAFQLF